MNTDECPVCYEHLGDGKFKLYCRHIIHGKCMFHHANSYLENYCSISDDDTEITIPCPLCRSEYHSKSQAYSVVVKGGVLDDLKEIINKDNVNDVLDRWGIYPLHIVASNGNVDMAKYLLDIGANINATAKMGHTPLYLSSMNGRTEMVKYLFDNGANVHIRHSSGRGPMEVAGNFEIALYFLKVV